VPAQDVVLNLDDVGGMFTAEIRDERGRFRVSALPLKSRMSSISTTWPRTGCAAIASSSCPIGLSSGPRAVIGPE
jgi:hypothetical protein